MWLWKVVFDWVPCVWTWESNVFVCIILSPADRPHGGNWTCIVEGRGYYLSSCFKFLRRARRARQKCLPAKMPHNCQDFCMLSLHLQDSDVKTCYNSPYWIITLPPPPYLALQLINPIWIFWPFLYGQLS